MDPAAEGPAAKFDPARARDYAAQSRIALAGYDACHDLAYCLLSATLGTRAAHVLVAGAGGTAREIAVAAPRQPAWRFTAVDPSRPMLDAAMDSLAGAGLAASVTSHLGYVADLAATLRFDAATLIGVLHHVPGDAAKEQLLAHIAVRLAPGAPLILACNRTAYRSQPLLLAAWRERWTMNGANDAEADAKLATILNGADPPASDADIGRLLISAGFAAPTLFFSSLFWGAWVTQRRP